MENWQRILKEMSMSNGCYLAYKSIFNLSESPGWIFERHKSVRGKMILFQDPWWEIFLHLHIYLSASIANLERRISEKIKQKSE